MLEIQRVLLMLGYGESHLVSMDGIYGENTRLAVMNFQQKSNLPITGSVGYETYLKLQDVYARTNVRENGNFPLREGDQNKYVRLVRAYLDILFSKGEQRDRDLTSNTFDENMLNDLFAFFARIGRQITNELGVHEFLRLRHEAEMICENEYLL